MQRLIIIFLLTLSVAGHGQQLSFIQVDTLTYNQYLRREWKPLIKSGKTALENDINYYYLQMRIAHAYFSLEQYRKAIKYYKNALEFNSYDDVANEYLYYCYKFSGMENDAVLQIGNLTTVQKKAMEIDDAAILHSIGFSYSHLFSDAASLTDSITAGLNTINEGIQKATQSLIAPRFDISHRIGSRVIVNHTASYLAKNELSYVITNGTEYLSPEQPVKQVEYGLGLEILIAEGLILKPGFHYMRSTIPIYSETNYGFSAGRDRTAVALMYIRNFASSVQLIKQTRYFDIGLSFVHHNFNQIGTNQAGIHATLYPFGNLNLYMTVDGYRQFMNYESQQSQRFVTRPLIGFRIHDNFWMEVSGSLTGQFNFYDLSNNIAYNNLEMSKRTFQAMGIVPLYKSGVRIFFGYQHAINASYYFPLADMLNPLNELIYQSHLITGGIKWIK